MFLFTLCAWKLFFLETRQYRSVKILKDKKQTQRMEVLFGCLFVCLFVLTITICNYTFNKIAAIHAMMTNHV
jgi:hypothetical protein